MSGELTSDAHELTGTHELAFELKADADSAQMRSTDSPSGESDL